MKFDVHVINDEKRPQSGCRVEVDLPESFPLSAGGGKLTEYTDEEGHARFETADETYGEVTIFVDGENKGRLDLRDAGEFTIVV
jgi:hypothetical protein